MGTGPLAYGVSLLLHLGVAVALLLGQRDTVERTPPSIEMAAGQTVVVPNVRFAPVEPPAEPEVLDTRPPVPAEVAPPPLDSPMTPPTRREFAAARSLPVVEIADAPPLDAIVTTVDPVAPAPVQSAEADPPPDAPDASEAPDPTREADSPPQPAEPVPPREPSEPVGPAQPLEPTEPREPAEPATADRIEQGGVERGVQAINLPRPVYPALSRRFGEEGTVVLAARIMPDGRATDVRVVRAPDHPRLIAAAREALAAARFRPALRNGRSVAEQVEIPFRFVLRE